MTVMNLETWINKLKYLAMKRNTFYSNEYPYNCGYIHKNGVISFDCIGLVKSLINEPTIAERTAPVGTWVKPGTVIPDRFGEIDILNAGTDVKWYFKGIDEGEYLYMAGHAGVFVGTFNDGGECNTVECTTDWGANGVTTSYTDPYSGRRFDHKGGTEMRSWEAHSKLTPYINYRKEEPSMFNDVPKTDKNYKYYKAVVDAGLMTKNKAGNFRPKGAVSRGALAIVLYRLLKLIKKLKG